MADPNLNDGNEREDWLPTSASLIERLQRQADASAWNRGWRDFFSAYYPVIVRLACRRGIPTNEASDVAQEVLSGIAQNIAEYRYDPEVCQFKTWLFRVANNRIADYFRRRNRSGRLVDSPGAEELELDAIADPNGLGPDAACERVFEQELLNSALERVAHRVKPMNMRLYMYHVIAGNDVEQTVAHFRDGGVKSADVHLARHRIQALVDAELASLARGDRKP